MLKSLVLLCKTLLCFVMSFSSELYSLMLGLLHSYRTRLWSALAKAKATFKQWEVSIDLICVYCVHFELLLVLLVGWLGMHAGVGYKLSCCN
jgi:hypothetical protein